MSSAITAVVVAGAIKKRADDKAQHAKDAATMQQQSREDTAEAQQRADFAPYRQAGGKALSRLESLMYGDMDISETPGYKFRLEEGYKGVERSQAGRRFGGRAAKEMARYGQGMASQEYSAEFDRLRSMTDIGIQGAAKTATLSAGTTQRLGSMYSNYGSDRAQREVDKGDSQTEVVQNLWTAYNQ